MMPIDIDYEITRLLHLAIIAQIQAWEAQNNLESLLEGEYVSGTPEHTAARIHLTDAVATLASEPESQPLIETLALADPQTLKDTLVSLYEEAQTTRGVECICGALRKSGVA